MRPCNKQAVIDNCSPLPSKSAPIYLWRLAVFPVCTYALTFLNHFETSGKNWIWHINMCWASKLCYDFFPPHKNDLLSLRLGAVWFLVDFQTWGNSHLGNLILFYGLNTICFWCLTHLFLQSRLLPELLLLTRGMSPRHLRPNIFQTWISDSHPANLFFLQYSSS